MTALRMTQAAFELTALRVFISLAKRDERMVSLLLSRGASIDLRTGTTSMTASLASNLERARSSNACWLPERSSTCASLRGGTALMMLRMPGTPMSSSNCSPLVPLQIELEKALGRIRHDLSLEEDTRDCRCAGASYFTRKAQIDHVLAFIQKYGPASEAPAEAEVEARAEPTQGQQHVEVEEVSNCGDRNASSIPGQLELAAQLVRIAM